MIRFILLSLFFPVLLSCSQKVATEPLILSYEDFGPPSMASQLIGNEWWQWQNHGDSIPRKYDIKVVVFKNTNLEFIRSRFPVNSAQENDYRYLDYSVALDYLESGIVENVIPSLTEKLQSTREIIESHFEN